MKLHRKELYLSISCFLMALLLTAVWQIRQQEAMAARIAPSLIRFHVLAESNSPEDQQLKLKVRTYFLDLLYRDLGKQADKQDTLNYIQEHLSDLERQTDHYISSQGYGYSTVIEICQDYFPQKTYGDYTFPCGVYDAVRITIGTGKGQNWWCILYPQLCFTESTYAVIPEDSELILQQLLDQEDYQDLLTPNENYQNSSFTKRKIKSKLWELITNY